MAKDDEQDFQDDQGFEDENFEDQDIDDAALGGEGEAMAGDDAGEVSMDEDEGGGADEAQGSKQKRLPAGKKGGKGAKMPGKPAGKAKGAKPPKGFDKADKAEGRKAVSKPPKSARSPAVKERASKPTQPIQTDKFGLTLIIIVMLLTIGNFIVWDMAGAKIDKTMFSRDTIDAYDLASPQVNIVAYETRGVLARERGEVDIVLLDKGTNEGVRIGDVYRPTSSPHEKEGAYFVEFCVFEVSEAHCRAWITLGTHWTARNQLRLTNIADVFPAGSTTASRKWEFQQRKLVEKRWPEGQ